jgi:hypothetical protein
MPGGDPMTWLLHWLAEPLTNAWAVGYVIGALIVVRLNRRSR